MTSMPASRIAHGTQRQRAFASADDGDGRVLEPALRLRAVRDRVAALAGRAHIGGRVRSAERHRAGEATYGGGRQPPVHDTYERGPGRPEAHVSNPFRTDGA